MRFPGFEGEWEDNTLGEICKMQAGKFVSASEIYNEWQQGLFHCYGGNGLRGYTKSNNQNGMYSLIGRQGALCGNVTLVDGKFYATEHAVVVTPKSSTDNLMLHHLLKHLNLNQYATGAAQPGLSVQNLEKVEVKMPKAKAEQQKIASFLSLIDERIKTQNKILQHYQSLIQNLREAIFKQKIGFKDKDGNAFPSWEIYKLKDIAERIIRKNLDNNQNVLTISAQHGLISQLEFFNKSVSAKNVEGYYLLKNGDFAYNKSYSTGYPMGAIKQLSKYDEGVVSTLYICFRFYEKANKDFMEHYFESQIQNNELEKIAQEGARNHGLLNVGVGDFFNIEIKLPCIKEQVEISKLFSSLSMRMNIENDILEKFKTQKVYLLKSLFI